MPGGRRTSGWLELGIFGVALPEEAGGAGGTVDDLCAMVDEAAAALVPGTRRHRPRLPRWSSRFAGRVARGVGVRRAHRGPRAERPSCNTDGGTASGTAEFVLGADAGGVLLLPRGDDFLLVDATADGVTVEPLTADRLLASAGPRRARRRARRRRCRVAATASRTWPRRCWPPRPPDWPGGHSDRRRVREGARAVRQADRQLPGDQAHVRRDAAALRAGRGGRGRRRPRRRWRTPTTQLSIAAAVAAATGIESAQGQRQGLHPGARRHRHHLGARRASVSASRVRDFAIPRRPAALAAPRRGAHPGGRAPRPATST